MPKYYKVLKDTFMWKEGAILKNGYDGGRGYQVIEDIWDKVELKGEYITGHIIENPANADFFIRVYPDTLKGNIFHTKDQLIDLYNKSFK